MLSPKIRDCLRLRGRRLLSLKLPSDLTGTLDFDLQGFCALARLFIGLLLELLLLTQEFQLLWILLVASEFAVSHDEAKGVLNLSGSEVGSLFKLCPKRVEVELDARALVLHGEGRHHVLRLRGRGKGLGIPLGSVHKTVGLQENVVQRSVLVLDVAVLPGFLAFGKGVPTRDQLTLDGFLGRILVAAGDLCALFIKLCKTAAGVKDFLLKVRPLIVPVSLLVARFEVNVSRVGIGDAGRVARFAHSLQRGIESIGLCRIAGLFESLCCRRVNCRKTVRREIAALDYCKTVEASANTRRSSEVRLFKRPLCGGNAGICRPGFSL